MSSDSESERKSKRTRYDDTDVEDETSSVEESETESVEEEEEGQDSQDIVDQLETATSKIGDRVSDLDIVAQSLKSDVRRLEKCVDLIFKKIKEMSMYLELSLEGKLPTT